MNARGNRLGSGDAAADGSDPFSRQAVGSSPTDLGPPRYGTAARWVLAFRLARREVRRNPWRHALVVLLIFVPVLTAMAAFSAMETIERRDEVRSERNARGSGIVVHSDHRGGTIGLAQARGVLEPVAVVEEQMTAADWMVSAERRSDGLGPHLLGAEIRTASHGSQSASLFEVRSGRLPSSPDEVFLTEVLASGGPWYVGDTVEFAYSGARRTVVGTGAYSIGTNIAMAVLDSPDPAYLDFDQIPGLFVDVAGSYGAEIRGWVTVRAWLPSGPDPTWVEVTQRDHGEIVPAPGPALEEPPASLVVTESGEVQVVRPDPSWFAHTYTSDSHRMARIGGTLAAAGLTMVVAVVVSAAYAVSSRRQLRTVGLLSSAGADPRLVRATLVLQGAIPGIIAVLAAVVALVAGSQVAERAGWIERLVKVSDLGVAVSMWGVALAFILGVGAGVVASWLPARTASRVPVLSALAGRRPVGPVPTRLPVLGVVLLGVGAALLVFVMRSDSDGGTISTVVLPILAIIANVLGGVATAPTLVAGVGRLAHRTRGTLRLALRGLARHRLQSAATVAAVAVCLALPVGFLTARAAEADRQEEQSHPLPAVGDVPGPGTGAPVRSHVPLQKNVETAAAVQVTGDLASPDALALRDRSIEALGPDALSVAVVEIALQTGGWAKVAVVDVAGSPAALEPWTAEALRQGSAIPLSAMNPAGGAAILVEGAHPDQAVTVAATPSGSPGAITGIDADYLVASSSLPETWSTLAVTQMVVLHPEAGSEDLRRTILGERATSTPTLEEVRTMVAPMDQRELHMAHVDFHGPGWFPDTETSEPWDRALLIISVAGAGLSLLVLTITLVLRGVDGEDDTRVALAVGAPPAKMRRLRATEGVILAGLGAILALPLGWIPVTAVEVGEVRRSGVWTDAVTSRLHLPTWEVIPILLAPMVVAAVLWIVVPAGRALLRRRSVDTLLPRA